MECAHCHEGLTEEQPQPEMRVMEEIATVPSIRQSEHVYRSGDGISLTKLALIVALVVCLFTWLAYNYKPFGQTQAGGWLIEQSQSILSNLAAPTATESAPTVAGCKPKDESDAERVDSFVVKFNGTTPDFAGLKPSTKEFLLVCFPVNPMIEFISDSAKANGIAALLDSGRTSEILEIVTGPTLAKGYWLIPARVATQAPMVSQPQVDKVDKVVVQVQQPTRTRIPTQAPPLMDVVIPTAQPTPRPTFGGHYVTPPPQPTPRPTFGGHYVTQPAALPVLTATVVPTQIAVRKTNIETYAPFTGHYITQPARR